MRFETPWFGNQFNLEFYRAEETEPYCTIKGFRIVNGSKGEFVSPPATKSEKTGKWWSHAYLSDEFQAAVLKKAKASRDEEPPF